VDRRLQVQRLLAGGYSRRALQRRGNRLGDYFRFGLSLCLFGGLGNGRSYDHLREHLPNRDIYVFERSVQAHPDCIPPADRMILGDFKDTAPAAAQRFAGQVALIHADVGSGDHAASRALAAFTVLSLGDLR
jgi:hypothetical protein